MRLTPIVPIAWVLVACAGTSTSARGTTGTATSEVLPIVPMRMLPIDAPDTAAAVFELRADGMIVDGRGRAVARIHGSRIVDPNGSDGEDSAAITVQPDGTVTSPIVRDGPLGRFDASDAFVFARQGITLHVGDDGRMHAGGRLDARFVPFDPRARRTAEVLMLLFVVATTGIAQM